MLPAATVTGTKELAPTAPTGSSLAAFGRCDPDGSSPPSTDLFAIVSDPFLVYDAQINAVTGARTDGGTSGFLIRSVTDPTSPLTFQEAFNSTDPIPPDCDDDHGHGHGHWHWHPRGHAHGRGWHWHPHGHGGGHWWGNHDHDDDEDCD